MSLTRVVSPQWDIGYSAFSLTDKALELIKAATVDDVQPAAVYAAEAIGSLMIVDSKLIGPAVDALGGCHSFRWEKVKLQIGLSAGGVAEEIRKSTPAIRGFLLITALKLFMPTDQIAEVLYEIYSLSSMLERFPVSDNQLESLVNLLEGYSPDLFRTTNIETCFMVPFTEALAEAVSPDSHINGNNSSLFDPPSPQQLARLLHTFFNLMRSGDLSRVVVTGTLGAAWVLSILCWLIPDSVAVSLDDKWIFGGDAPHTRRAHFILNSQERSNWTFEEHFQLEEISTLIEITDNSSAWAAARTAIPYNAIRGFCVSKFGPEAADAIGQCALGILMAGYRYLRLEGSMNSIELSKVCTPEFESEHRSMLGLIGWPPSAKTDFAEKVVESIKSCWDDGTNMVRDNDPHVYHQTLRQLLLNYLGSKYAPRRYSYSGSSEQSTADINENISRFEVLRTILLTGENIANHFILRSTTRGSSLAQIPRRDFVGPGVDKHKVPLKFFFRREIRDFLGELKSCSAPGCHDALRSGEESLILSGGGQVLYPVALMSNSTDIETLLAYEVIPGHLRFKNSRFPALVDRSDVNDKAAGDHLRSDLRICRDPTSMDTAGAFQDGVGGGSQISFQLARKNDYLVLLIETSSGRQVRFSTAQVILAGAGRPSPAPAAGRRLSVKGDDFFLEHSRIGVLFDIGADIWLKSTEKSPDSPIALSWGSRAIVRCCQDNAEANFYRAACFRDNLAVFLQDQNISVGTCVKFALEKMKNAGDWLVFAAPVLTRNSGEKQGEK